MKILGIDLGTTNSAVALVNAHGAPEMIANREGEYVTPSVIFFEDEQPVVGTAAKHSAPLDPENVVQLVKRQMGNPEWSFPTPGGRFYSAEELSALILRRLKEDAQEARREKFTHAVITVPAYFQDAQRIATKDAGEMAGLEVVRIINEPTAAALAFGVGTEQTGRIVVYDLGGGTFDVTVLDIAPGELKVLATGGDRSLGGVDWDDRIMGWLEEQFNQATGMPLPDDPRTEQDLRDRAEKAKHSLSSMSQTKVILSAGGHNEAIALSRAQFEELTSDLLERTRIILQDVVEDAGARWPEISKVLLVGGSTKMPAVARLIEEASRRPASREVHPDEAVALGAAIQGALIAAEMSSERRPSSDSGRGGAGDAASGPEETAMVEVTITDVTAHGTGLELVNMETGALYNEVVLPRGSLLPSALDTTIYTIRDNQTVWVIKVTQGDDEDLRYVSAIGEGPVTFDGPKPRGYPLAVKFSYDRDGLIHVSVSDGQTGRYFGELKIKRESNLSDAERATSKNRISGMSLG